MKVVKIYIEIYFIILVPKQGEYAEDSAFIE